MLDDGSAQLFERLVLLLDAVLHACRIQLLERLELALQLADGDLGRLQFGPCAVGFALGVEQLALQLLDLQADPGLLLVRQSAGIGQLVTQGGAGSLGGVQFLVALLQLIDQRVELVHLLIAGVDHHFEVGSDDGFQAGDSHLAGVGWHVCQQADLAGDGVQGQICRLARVDLLLGTHSLSLEAQRASLMLSRYGQP
ncbi:hypothetical protein D3C79_786150 [compost metagenome]